MTLTNPLTKLAAAVVAVSLVVGIAFAVVAPRAEAASLTPAQIQSIISLLQSFGADAATIANVNASLTGQTPSVPSTPSSSACTFTRDLTIGSTGADVTCLQNALIASGYTIPAGATGYFGVQTQAAVSAWQKAAGVTPTAGYFGAKSRAAFAVTSPTTPTTPTPTGTGISVSAGVQPANSLAPQGASRVPFTRFTLTAGNDGDVVVNSVQVQRTGFGQDAAFQGVILIDESTGMQVGTAKTFNSNHQAAVGQTMTIPRGTSKTFLVAGNMASSLASYAGEAPAISVVGINTTATVSGALPITGAYHTTNATLTVGSLQLEVSNAFASNSNVTKTIGTTAHKFTGIRLVAGSAEDVMLKSITFNQTGSVSASDLANVMINVAGTNYPTVLSADGRYYTATFGGTGILIAKGNQVDAYIQADIVGSNASGRTVIFDIDRTTDVFGVGTTYGYGISPSTSGGVAVSTLTRGSSVTTETTGTPYVFSSVVTVQGGSVTSISKANEVPAQNIAINLSNQPLGGYVVDLVGENMTVASTVITLATSTASTGLLTNLTIVDENGSVVAGPVDATWSSGSMIATFSDTITYKTGRHVYTIRGKVPSGASNGATITASTNPSAWGTVRGETTGNSLTLSVTSFSMNSMTVKAGSLSIGRSTSPASQTLVPGGSSVLMANFQFDATQSGEDVRFASAAVKLRFDVGSYEGAPSKLSACQLFDGSMALNTGSNILNPSTTATTSDPYNATITLDNAVTVAKGTVKTLGMRCNVSSTADNNSQFAWDVQDADGSSNTVWAVTGATSGTTITETDSSDSSVIVTIGAGSITVTTDASSPSYMIASAGSTGVTNGAFKFRASNENVTLTKLGLNLTNSASSTSGDLIKATIWDGATKVGEAYFVGSSDVATSTLTTPVTLTKDQDKTLTIKLDLADVGTSQAVTFSGHLVAVDYVNAEGVGQSSGSTFILSSAAGSTAVSGTRVMKSFPTFSLDTLPSVGVADGRLARFKVTADSKGPVGITQFGVNIATSTAIVTNVTIYGFTDSNYSNAISGVSSDGNLQATIDATVPSTGNVVVGVTTAADVATVIQVPAGETRYFEVRGSVSNATSGASVTTKVLGNTSFPSSAATLDTENPLVVATGAGTTFVWSPNSTTTAVRADVDWTNGFGVAGLPSGGLIQTRSQ